MTWRLKDILTAKRAVYYGKAIAGRPAFIAPQMLPAFLRLRAERTSYATIFRRGELSLCGKLVMDALKRRPVAVTRELRMATGFSRPSRRAEFDRAMKELQAKFLILKIEERYEPFTYVWSTLAYRWGEAMAKARELRREEAAYQIVKRYFLIAAYGAEHTIASTLGIEPKLVAHAIRSLERGGLLATKVDGSGLPRGSYALTERHLVG